MVSSSGWRAPLIVHALYIGLLALLGLWVAEFVVLGLILLLGVLFLCFRRTPKHATGESASPIEPDASGEVGAPDKADEMVPSRDGAAEIFQ